MESRNGEPPSWIGRELREIMSTQWRSSIIEAGRQEKARMGTGHLLKRGFQLVHVMVALGFVVLAIVEFVLDPPYFDAVAAYTEIERHGNATKIPKDTFYNLTRSAAPSSIRRIMDLPVLLLFVSYFVVLLWRSAKGFWSFLMTVSMFIILLVFIIINYWAHGSFDWRYFSSRGYGVIIEVFCFALGWTSITMATFVKIDWYPFRFTTNTPAGLCMRSILVLWNFFAVLTFMFFCLLIWFSRLYYSWVCVQSLNDVLLMCQFTNLVQCYACEEAASCTHLDMCVNTAKSRQTFHCESPLAGLHDVEEAFCVFNYNIGFFTFIMVFAYVGGTYFFLSNAVNFTVRCVKVLSQYFILFMSQKTRPHIEKIYSYSISKTRSSKRGELDQTLEEPDDNEDVTENLLSSKLNVNHVDDDDDEELLKSD